jgi:S1-C subfamily serine protease
VEFDVNHDREEWRRPWRLGDTPSAETAVSAPGASGEVTGPVRSSAAGSARATQRLDQPATPGQPALGSWQRPDGTGVVAPVAGVDPRQPIARFPQPPPTGWDAAASGPGSPSGSVRPPDTTGTVDAPAQKRSRNPLATLLIALFGAVIGTATTLAVMGTGPDEVPSAAPPAPVEQTEPGTVSAPSIEPLNEGAVIPAVAEAVTPSVVRIDVVAGEAPSGGPTGPQGGLGSGVIYRSDGYILTNFHVIDGAGGVEVRLASGELLEAEVIGTDELNDLAVLRVDRDDLPAINLRNGAEPLQVGETVVAIGSPFGLDASVTAGVISALDRELRLDEPQAGGGALTIPSVIQTDAAINPGNSGGALVDARGRLVGINTAILTRSGASQGVGFAVSAEQAMSSADQLIDQGFVRHPLLGITGTDVTTEVAERFGLATTRGAVIDSVQEGTGAAESGLRPGDIITSVDGDPLATMSQLVAEVRRRAPGDIVELEVVRDGEELDVDVELSERPR